MSVLNATGLKKHYGATEVLLGVDLRVEAGDKIGVVGRNGEGKTTLLRLIEGEEKPDAGAVHLSKDARLGYVEQRPDFAGLRTRDYVASGLEEVHALRERLAAVEEEMAEVEGGALERAMRRHGELTERMEHLGGWDAEHRVEAVLSGIGLAPELWGRDADTLSGGEKSRAALARELVASPDLLLLDEPTNHLDVAGIEWLEAWLRDLSGAVVIVSHDRRLLDRAVSAIVEIEHGRLARYPGNYSRYLELKAERYEAALREWRIQQEFLRRERAFIGRHMGSQRTGEAKGRRKRLQRVERLERPHHDVRRPVIRLARTPRGGELVLEASGLACGYGDRDVFRDVSLRIGRGERVGIVGPNGEGKSTLLRALAGRMVPRAGEIARGHGARCGYFDQESAEVGDEGTPYEAVRRARPTFTDEEIRSHLARFLFRGDEVDASLGTLSGGERSRVALALLVLGDPTWLALDEPTNHLDLAARTALEEFLGAFEGTLVCVSHDREFLDGLCSRIVEVRGGRAREFRGNYTDYREAVVAEQARAAEARAESERARAKRAKVESRPKPAPRAPRERGRPRNPQRLRKVEAAIMALEDRRKGLLEEMALERVYRDPDSLRDVQIALAEVERDLEHENAQWEEMIG